jgi:hypothetical protein
MFPLRQLMYLSFLHLRLLHLTGKKYILVTGLLVFRRNIKASPSLDDAVFIEESVT